MRAVVEGEGDHLGRQACAEDLAGLGPAGGQRLGRCCRSGSGRRTGDGGRRRRRRVAVRLQDLVARVQRAQVRDVVVPALALLHDGARLEAREDRPDLLVVVLLDLVEGVDVVADALVQADRAERRVAGHVDLQAREQVAEREAVGVEQRRVALDVVQHRPERRRRIVAGPGDRVEHRLGLVDVLAVGVEDRLPDLVGCGALRLGLLLLVGEQHDDLAVRGEHVLQLCDDVAGRRARRAGGGRGTGCRRGARLRAASLQRQAGDDRKGSQGGKQANAHRWGVRSSDQPRRPGWNRGR